MITTAHLPTTSISQVSLLCSPRPTAMIDAGLGRAIWRKVHWELSSLQDPELSHPGETLLWKLALPSRGSQPRSPG